MEDAYINTVEVVLELDGWTLLHHKRKYYQIVCPCGDYVEFIVSNVCKDHWGKMPRELFAAYRLLVS